MSTPGSTVEPSEAPDDGPLFDSPGTELSSNRTAMSFERTRMSTDRTLMATIRTAFSLIGFGFTLHAAFVALGEQIVQDMHEPARRFGLVLVALGVGLLAAGLWNHHQSIAALRSRRDHLLRLGLVRRGPQHRTSPTAVVAILLLGLGLAAALSIGARIGPLS